MLKGNEFELFLEQVNGLMVIDETGKLIYMNQQCADYIRVDLKDSIGKPVEEVFPASKMRQCMNESTSPVLQFYFVDGRASASLNIPMRQNGKVVGLLEYDLFQDFEFVDHFLENYRMATTDELKYYREEVRKLQRAKYSIKNILGNSEQIRLLRNQIQYAAGSSSTVLISGETGTGKELVAHAIHNLSQRRLRDFIRVNAASIPENLAESELFGYVEGSFTGAKKGGAKGKFLLANQGTLFIDEIDKMPYSLQPKLLRALQEKEIDPIGSDQSFPVDVRIIVSSNRDLKKMVDEGLFREDLFYRLNVLEIKICPLRERREDIPEVAKAIVSDLNQSLGKHIQGISPASMDQLKNRDWPGNIRELRNVLERAMNYIGDSETELILRGGSQEQPETQSVKEESVSPLAEVVRRAERQAIQNALIEFRGNKAQTARSLGITRPALYKKMTKLDL